MAGSGRPPFRADHVGSLLRPKAVADARAKKEKGEITAAQLRAIEDAAIKDAVRLQESAGISAVTDGEIRRAFWHVDFLAGFDGIAATQSNYAVSFRGDGGETAETRSMMIVDGKIRRSRQIQVEDFKFLKSQTSKTAKACIPSPTYLHFRGGRKIVDRTAYPTMEEFWADLIAAYQAEIAALAEAGCTYLQLDDVSVSYLCDPSIRAHLKEDGLDPEKLPAEYARVNSALLAKRPQSMAVTMHTCRGNFQSMWMAEGGYDAVADAVFNGTDVDGFFLEYDTDRAGGFEPLRFVPKTKKVVLGLVSSKRPELESKDALKRRIDQAAKFLPLENLCLSPQCGFASTHHGNRISEDVERRKLALIVEVAREVWGSAE
jgi:5-methyltetrahydropteroyltriglutamate--homocysteine methyltransferase